MVEKADAFGALRRHDVIDVLRDRRAGRTVEIPGRAARVNGSVRTFRLARSAIDAFARDRRRHLVTGSQLNDVEKSDKESPQQHWLAEVDHNC